MARVSTRLGRKSAMSISPGAGGRLTAMAMAGDAMQRTTALSGMGRVVDEDGDGGSIVDILFDMIDNIDCNGNKVTKDELIKVGKALKDDDFVDIIDGLEVISDDGFTREQLHEALFGAKPSTLGSSLMFFNLIWMLPLMYSANTRLPFICLALEITVTRGGELWQVGIALGVYQACRSIANAVISAFGGSNPMATLQLPMVAMGLFAWIYVLLATEGVIGGDPVWSLLALGGVGLTEIIVNLQTAIIRETQLQSPSRIADPIVLANRLRIQYAAVAAGACLSFVLGGALFTYYDFTMICYLGIAYSVTTIFLSGVYLIQSRRNAQVEHINEGIEGIDMKSIMYRLEALRILEEEAFDAFQDNGKDILGGVEDHLSMSANLWRTDRGLQQALATLHKSFLGTSTGDLGGMVEASLEIKGGKSSKMLGRNRGTLLKDMNAYISCVIDRGSAYGNVSQEDFVEYLAPRVFDAIYGGEQKASVQVIWPYMKLVIATQGIMALCIGTFLSTALLLYTQKHGIEASVVGLLLGLGEGAGALTIFAPTILSKFIHLSKADSPGFFFTILERPLHVIAVLFALSSATMGFASNSFAAAIVFQFLMSCVNDLSVSLINELIATSLPNDKFRKMQGFGQWLRRCGNMLTGITGPILFGVNQNLPFLLFGGLVFTWTFGLWYFVWVHAKKINPDGEKNGPISAFSSSAHWHERERDYYAANKEDLDKELLGSKDHSTDIEHLDFCVRKLNAALNAEQAKRKKLEGKLEMVLQKVNVDSERELVSVDDEQA